MMLCRPDRRLALTARRTSRIKPLFLKIMLFAIPASLSRQQLGWIVAEVGRQPWIVYGVLKTADAVSRSITAAQVWCSLLGLYASLREPLASSTSFC